MKGYRTRAILLIMGLLFCSCGTTYKLTMTDAGFPLLENTPLDVLKKEPIYYKHIASTRFDTFFKESAIVYGGFVVGKKLTAGVTKNLKGFARSRMAKGQLSQNAEEYLAGRDPDSLSGAETVALLKLEKKENEMTKDEITYMGKALGNLGGASVAVAKASKASVGLIGTGTDLLKNGKSELTLFGIPKFWIIKGAVTGTKTSLKQLKEVQKEAPALIEETAVLTEGIKMLMAADEETETTDSGEGGE